MNIHKISEFIESMKNIESFLSELAARDSELRYAGIGSTKLWDSYSSSMDSFEEFDRNLYELTRLSKFVDFELYNRIKDLSSTSLLVEGITQIAVSIRISEKRKEREVVLRRVASTMADTVFGIIKSFGMISISPSKGLFFDESDVSLSKILVGLNRLIPLAEDVVEKYTAKQRTNNEVFKPANINIDNINIYINDTLNIISSSGNLGSETKEKLIEYLEDIRTELAVDTPKWKNIVGGLVIVSAILSGLADAPQAIDNIQKAITEILGTSIEKQYPHNILAHNSEIPKLIIA